MWEYSDEESGGSHDMTMDVGERIRFKVREELFRDTTPSGPSINEVPVAAEERLKKISLREIECSYSVSRVFRY